MIAPCSARRSASYENPVASSVWPSVVALGGVHRLAVAERPAAASRSR